MDLMFFVYILNISLTVSTLICQFFSYNFLKLGEKYQIFEKFGQPHFDCTLYRPWTEIRTCTLCFRKIRYIFINNSQITFRYFVLFSRYKIKNSLENPLKQHLCAAPLGVLAVSRGVAILRHCVLRKFQHESRPISARIALTPSLR